MLNRILIILAVSLLLLSCGQPDNNTQASSSSQMNLSGFTETKIPGSDAVIVTKKDGSNKMLEQGIVRNGEKDGPWTLFHENESIKSISSYVNGRLNGAYLEFNNRGQLEKRVEYLDNQYNGLFGEYKYGRPLKEITFENGVQNGPFRVWSDMGKLTQTGANKNGKLDGTLDYFDDEERLIMSYEYKDGELVSGGLIEKEK